MRYLECPELNCGFGVEDEPGAQSVLLHHLQGFPHYFYRAAALARSEGVKPCPVVAVSRQRTS